MLHADLYRALRLPPHSPDAERRVLGAILLDPAALAKIRDALDASDFYSDRHRVIYQTVCALADRGDAIDNVTLSDALRAHDGVIASYLAELVAETPSASNVAQHAALVVKKAQARRFRAMLLDTLNALEDGADVDQLHADLAQRLATFKRDARGNALCTRLADVPPQPLQWLWPGRVPLGKLTILDGDPGLGKSLLTLDLAARVSRGAAMPDGVRGDLAGPRGVVLLSAEDDPADTIRPRLDAAGADVERIVLATGVRERAGGVRSLHIEDSIALRSVIAETNAALLVIDPFTAHLRDARDTHVDHDIRRALAPLAALAAETGVAILLVRHLNKTTHGNPLYRGGGSIGIVGAARSGLLVAPDPEDAGGQTRVLALTKSNLAAPAPSLRYCVVAAGGVARIEWLGESTQTAADLLTAAAESAETRTERDEAAAWLAAILADGPVPARRIRAEAEQAGHAWRTVRRAQQRLGVLVTKQNYHEGWVWQLRSSKVANTEKVATFGKDGSEGGPNPAKYAEDGHFVEGGHPANGIGGGHLRSERGTDADGKESWLELS